MYVQGFEWLRTARIQSTGYRSEVPSLDYIEIHAVRHLGVRCPTAYCPIGYRCRALSCCPKLWLQTAGPTVVSKQTYG